MSTTSMAIFSNPLFASTHFMHATLQLLCKLAVLMMISADTEMMCGYGTWTGQPRKWNFRSLR